MEHATRHATPAGGGAVAVVMRRHSRDVRRVTGGGGVACERRPGRTRDHPVRGRDPGAGGWRAVAAKRAGSGLSFGFRFQGLGFRVQRMEITL